MIITYESLSAKALTRSVRTYVAYMVLLRTRTNSRCFVFCCFRFLGLPFLGASVSWGFLFSRLPFLGASVSWGFRFLCQAMSLVHIQCSVCLKAWVFLNNDEMPHATDKTIVQVAWVLNGTEIVHPISKKNECSGYNLNMRMRELFFFMSVNKRRQGFAYPPL